MASRGHWTDSYYGELYLEGVEDLLPPRLSAHEADLIASLLLMKRGDRVLDIACGHGRHHTRLADLGFSVCGLDRSAPYLARARVDLPRGSSLVRGDLRSLPFRAGASAAAFSWYSSLFMYGDPENARALGELGRAVRPGGRILVEHGNPMRLTAHPVEHATCVLANGTLLEEHSTGNSERGVDRLTRRLVRADGSRLEATAELRYYTPAEWGPLADAAGLRVARMTSLGDTDSEPFRQPGPDAPDLIVVLEKRS